MAQPVVLKGWGRSPSDELDTMLVSVVFKFNTPLSSEVVENRATLQLYQHEETDYGRLALADADGACDGFCDTSTPHTFYIIQSNQVKTALSFTGKPLRSMQCFQSGRDYVCEVVVQASKGAYA